MASEPAPQLDVSIARHWIRTNRTRLLRFGAVGLTGVGVNFAVFTTLFYFLLAPAPAGGPTFVFANACGFVVSVFTNFVLNDAWTWGDREKGGRRHWVKRLVRYYITASGAGAVQLLTAWLSLWIWTPLAPTILGFDAAAALGVLTGIGCGMAINFTASHLWAFRDAPTPSGS